MLHAYEAYMYALDIHVSFLINMYASQVNMYVNISICTYKRRYIQVPTLHLQVHACRLIFTYRSPTFYFRMVPLLILFGCEVEVGET